MLDPQIWAATPFHFWSAVFFVLGTIVGSFLNVCIYRMPRAESVVSPPSHCPHCHYSIPGYLNIPLVTWLYLRGKCANCGARISIRYFLVELLTGVLFLACWLSFGHRSPMLAVANCVLLAGFIVATFIDIEHFIIPDEITIGGAVAGFFFSAIAPVLQADWLTGAIPSHAIAVKRSAIGLVVGGGIVYGILRFGKMLFGRQKFDLEPGARVIFTETSMLLPNQEILYEDLFYRRSDSIQFQAERVELIDRCYQGVMVRLTPAALQIGNDSFDPETMNYLEAVTERVSVPREAMGLGDVKFMAAIGAFVGWQGAIFSLMFSAIIGSLVGVTLIALKKQEWSSRLPYGPYIALAATVWIFGGKQLTAWWLQ